MAAGLVAGHAPGVHVDHPRTGQFHQGLGHFTFGRRDEAPDRHGPLPHLLHHLGHRRRLGRALEPPRERHRQQPGVVEERLVAVGGPARVRRQPRVCDARVPAEPLRVVMAELPAHGVVAHIVREAVEGGRRKGDQIVVVGLPQAEAGIVAQPADGLQGAPLETGHDPAQVHRGPALAHEDAVKVVGHDRAEAQAVGGIVVRHPAPSLHHGLAFGREVDAAVGDPGEQPSAGLGGEGDEVEAFAAVVVGGEPWA